MNSASKDLWSAWGGAFRCVCTIGLSCLACVPHRRLLVPGSPGLLDTEPTSSAEDPDGPKLFLPVCRDFLFPGMCPAGMFLHVFLCENRVVTVLNILLVWQPEMWKRHLPVTLHSSKKGFELMIWQHMGKMRIKIFSYTFF